MEFRVDDLTSDASRELVLHHLRGMNDTSPPESVHALGLESLQANDVIFWTAWVGDELAGCGALKTLDPKRGEIKSMRVADDWLGKGIGRAMLLHVMAHARASGMTSLWLETGSSEPFQAALKLYESEGFERCGPFQDYTNDPFSVFMKREL